MHPSQYKDYVLALLFVRYVSDKYAGQKDADVVIPSGGGFADLVKLRANPHLLLDVGRAPIGLVRSSRARSCEEWAWVELNYRPRAYQLDPRSWA